MTDLAEPNSSWAACFTLMVNNGSEGQAVADGLSRLDVNTFADSLYQATLQIMPVEDQPRYYYVLTALSLIKALFVDWNDAVSSNATRIEGDISTILATLDPDQRSSFAVDDLYQSLMLGLPFFLAYNRSGTSIGLSLESIGPMLIKLAELARVPLLNISTPLNTTGSIEATALPSILPQFTTTMTSGIQYGLQSITNSLSTFQNITTDGAFASLQAWTVPQDAATLTQPLYTFLVSSILAQNNWTVLALVGIDVAALSQNSTGTLPRWALKSCPTCTPLVNFGCTNYDVNGMCGRWWYSEDLNSSFTLVQAGNPNGDPTDMIISLYNLGWTTGSLLFENAAICDEPPSLSETLSTIPKWQRPASPLKDYMDSWFWRLLAVASLNDTSGSVDIVVSDEFNTYIESQPGPVRHPGGPPFNISGGQIDFSCMSQLDLQLASNWNGVWLQASLGQGALNVPEESGAF